MRTWRWLRLQICCMLLPDLAWVSKIEKPLTVDPSWALKALERPVLFNGDHIGALMFAKLAKWWNDPVNGSIRLRRHYMDLSKLATQRDDHMESKRLEEAYKELEVCYLWSIEREDKVARIVRLRNALTDISSFLEDDDVIPRLEEEEQELRGLDSTYLGMLLDNRHYMSEHYRISSRDLESDTDR